MPLSPAAALANQVAECPVVPDGGFLRAAPVPSLGDSSKELAML
ncbi:MAG: hypothetical protein ABI614_25300 [Planctomycetota bacterium]